ncbi:LLM class flavin-dependent oxidoreductase [Streptomyces sp. bgisy154]|uniref:LLM class flavin-dependent oxidoreductase n=1 Tax=Streptomyces sp. bgisy154 TaxID=3413794 RepID=UPI003D73738C
MTSIGAIFRPQLPPERLRDIARLVDDAGLDELWLWEDCFRQGGISSAAAVLAWTERVRVGVGLLPVPLRNVAVTAMEAATLHRMFPGRARIGVGHGVQDWMGQAGARVDSPVTLLREYTVALRALLNGERVTVKGRYVRLDDVGLDWPPTGSGAAPAEVLVGAVGERTVRLSGEVADGTVLNESASPERVREVRRIVERERAAAGRNGARNGTRNGDGNREGHGEGTGRRIGRSDGEGADQGTRHGSATRPHQIVVYLFAATGEGAAERLRGELIATGLDSVPGLGVAGDAETVATAVRRFADAGADSVVLLPTADEPDPEGFLRFVAEDVRPLAAS